MIFADERDPLVCFDLGEVIECNGTLYVPEEKRLTVHDAWFWIYLSIYIALILVAGLMSGLTMGLLSLDLTTLKILKQSGTTDEQRYASRILPLISRHHLLLVSLLLANAASVESMPIFLDRISDPIIAIIVSVTAVLLFGEIIPQALCTRYGLAIGAYLTPFVYCLMALLFVIAWPIAKLLDCLLGQGHGTFYRRAQLKVLVDLHGPGSSSHPGEEAGQLSSDEVLIIKGALDMKHKTARDSMLDLNHVFMIDVDGKIDETTMDEILHRSHSRIPVYEGAARRIIGQILVKTLIKLDPSDATPVRDLMGSASFRPIPAVPDDTPLYDMLNYFQMGKSHLCLVQDKAATLSDHSQPKILGIITLEDVIEELIQEEIVDETDVNVNVDNQPNGQLVPIELSPTSLHGNDVDETNDASPLLPDL